MSGDVTDKFIDYTYMINRDWIEERNMFKTPQEVRDIMAHYPETTICVDK